MIYILVIQIIMHGVTWTATGSFDTIEQCEKARAEFLAAPPVEGASKRADLCAMEAGE